jgi:hypothetical protein
MHMHVFSETTPSDTGADATYPKYSLLGRQLSATLKAPQGISASTFLRPRQILCRPDLAHPSPWGVPLAQHGGLPCTFLLLQSSPMAHHSRYRQLESIQRPDGVGCPPLKTPPDSNALMSVYVCILRYMYIYARICMYMYVYVCIYPDQVNVCICMYICICMYMCISGIYAHMIIWGCI